MKKIGLTNDGVEKYKCKACGKEYSCSSKGGTSHLNHHISKFLMISRFDDVGNMILLIMLLKWGLESWPQCCVWVDSSNDHITWSSISMCWVACFQNIMLISLF